MNLDDIELHDAVLSAVRINPPAQTVEVDVEWYSVPDSPERAPATILFSGVDDVSVIADFKQLARHAGPGNVVYWQPQPLEGATMIYVIGGCLSIRSKAVEFRARDIP